MAQKAKANKVVSTDKIWAVLRIAIGIIMIWAFLDKMVGLGYSTCNKVDPQTKEASITIMCEKSVAKGASPTTGFLKFATKGPLKEFYGNLAGNKLVDIAFMSGLLLIGLCLITGIGIKVASVSGILLLIMMWSAVLPPENNPILDDHIIYAIVLFGVMKVNKTQVWGLGKWWQSQSIVKKYPLLA